MRWGRIMTIRESAACGTGTRARCSWQFGGVLGGNCTPTGISGSAVPGRFPLSICFTFPKHAPLASERTGGTAAFLDKAEVGFLVRGRGRPQLFGRAPWTRVLGGARSLRGLGEHHAVRP